jgi:hypothetical protein
LNSATNEAYVATFGRENYSMNDVSPRGAITQRAIQAIGEDDPSADYVLRPEEHARGLPRDAGPLRRILEREEFVTAGNEYRADDGAAQWAQARFKKAGRIALCAALAATLLGALFLILPTKEFPPAVRVSGAVIEYLLVFVTFLAARYNARRMPFQEWMTTRGRAEIARVKLFDDVLKTEETANPDELPLLPLKLEYFRRYQLGVQERYYKTRCKYHEAAARRIRTLQTASFAIAGTAGTLGLLDILSLLEFDSLRSIASVYQGVIQTLSSFKIDSDRGLVALGIAASAIYGFATAISLLSLHERNAARYRNVCANLVLLQKQLEAARDAAVAGNQSQVNDFVNGAHALMSAEHQEWVRWRDWPPHPDVRAVYIVVPK